MTDRRASIPGRTSHVVAAVALLAMGCAPTYSTAQVQAVGEYQSGAKEAFGQKYRELQKSEDERPSAAANVKVLDETVPPGVVIHGDVLSVEDGHPLTIVGRYDFFGPQGGPWMFSPRRCRARRDSEHHALPVVDWRASRNVAPSGEHGEAGSSTGSPTSAAPRRPTSPMPNVSSATSW